MLAVAAEHVLDCGDGVRLMGVHSAQGDRPRPLVVLLHGWEGSAESSYLLSLGAHLFACGYDLFRLNFRDHGPTHHLNRGLFHSCRIAEVVGAVRAVQERFAPPALAVAGFSLGGNFALRVAVRAPAAGIDLRCAVGVSPVLHPRSTLAALGGGWFGYEQYFVRKWKRSLRLKQRHFPDDYDLQDILALDNLRDMTDMLVRRYTEYPDLDRYFAGYAILDDVLAGLEVPSEIVLAEDDPIIPAADRHALPRTPQLRVTAVPHGGHCGFLERLDGESWADRAVAAALARAW